MYLFYCKNCSLTHQQCNQNVTRTVHKWVVVLSWLCLNDTILISFFILTEITISINDSSKHCWYQENKKFTGMRICEYMQIVKKNQTKLIETEKWMKISNSNWRKSVFDFVSVSNEAFALVIYKNDTVKWNNQASKQEKYNTNKMDTLLLNLFNTNEINNNDKDKPPLKQARYNRALKGRENV